MRYHSVKMNKRPAVLLLFLFFLSCVSFAQVPERPVPQRLVNDIASVLSTYQQNELERRLVAFTDTTSNQIVVVTVNDLGGEDKSMFAYDIGEKWGVGSEKFNNGVVILIKPKSGNKKGEVFIAVGYGLEGAVPDAVAKRITEEEILPHFRNNDYYGGISAALDVLMPIISGEISVDQYMDDNISTGGIISIVFFAIFMLMVVLLASKGGGSSNLGGGNHSGTGLLDIILLSQIFGGMGRSGGFGGGLGSGGGIGGGFGGFGGGHFGGGGAGGSW